MHTQNNHAHTHGLVRTFHGGWRTSSAALLTLALLALGACDVDDADITGDQFSTFEDEIDELPTAPVDSEVAPRVRDQPVLVLGAGSAQIDGLASELDLVLADDLDVSTSESVLAESHALAVDLSSSTAADIETWKPLLNAAWRLRVPIVFTNVNEASTMAKAIGFGVEGEVVVAESLAPVVGFRLHSLGDPHDDVDADGELQVDAGPSVGTAQIVEQIDALADLPPVAATGGYPAGSYALFVLAPSGHTNWFGYDQQAVTRNIGFRVELFADADENRKYMLVSGEGSGVNAGTPHKDTDTDFAVFQEQVEVEIFPLHAAVMAAKHAPVGVGGSHTFDTSANTSTDVAVSNGVPTLNFSIENGTSQPVTLDGFTVVDESALNRASWRFRMNETSAGEYASWSDMLLMADDEPKIAHVPVLATATLTPSFEALYWVGQAFDGVAKTIFDYDVTYLHVRWTGHPVYSPYMKVFYEYIYGHRREVAVDFSMINLPQAGTLRFLENWTADAVPSRWLPVVEGFEHSADWTTETNNWIYQEGNAGSFGPDGLLRGTYVEAFDTHMKDGTLSTKVLPTDDDSWGLMYGIQDSGNYYRASINKQWNFAQIEKFVDGVGTVLATVPCQPTLNTWNTLKLVRSGTAHHFYLEGVKLVSAYDTTHGTGSVALYSAYMTGVKFSAVKISRPFEGDRNLAYGQPATESSTKNGSSASLAVDGGTNGVWSNGSVTHTEYTNQAWWRVDLGSMRTVNDVSVWSRTDPCCTWRLADYDVELLDENLAVVETRTHAGVSPTTADFDMGGAVGRYLRVKLNGTNYLSLAEVEVWGPDKI
ncbi:galactose-binding domain-containing protein [Enhygromyxa salina]|uniref:F5/8 type C domain protein n=1 Tax=Enhygromyxa salina TaxID=215803 RepID=A0A2S9XLC9_9BACT|nr:discoidin domain-containing protein [Enhygromyxa salina]PRP93679.1 F5/8 type C domain protein [Enhygromyxa salina]